MKPEDQNSIELYLAGELSAQERELLEQRLLTDVALQEELNLQKEMIAFLKAKEKARLKEELNKLWAEQPQQQPISLWRKLPAWTRIAAVLLPIALLAALFFLFPQVNKEELLAEHLAKPYPITVVKGAPLEEDSLYRLATIAYQQDDFTSSALHFQALFNFSGKEEHAFYWGLSLLYQKPSDPAAALQALDNVFKNTSLYTEQARWYAALAALKMEDEEKASYYLKQMSGARHWKAKEARELLGAN